MNYNLTVENIANENLTNIWSICTELAQKMAYPSFFCSGDWLKVCSDLHCPADTLFLLAVKNKDCVKALLPLVRKRNALGGRDLRFLGSDFYPDPLGLICNEADRSECISAIKCYLMTHPGWDRLILDWILKDELDEWRLQGELISIEPFKPLENNFSILVKALKRQNRRYVQSKVRNILDADGEMVISDNKSTQKAFLTSLFNLHKYRSEERAIKSSIEGSQVERFHSRLIEDSGNVRLYGLIIKQQMVAVLYGFEFCNRFSAFQIAHDPKYGELGPGTALLYFAIEDCCARGVSEFNFLQGNEGYKGIWTNDARMLYCGVLNHGTWRANLLNYLKQGKSIVKKGIGMIRRVA